MIKEVKVKKSIDFEKYTIQLIDKYIDEFKEVLGVKISYTSVINNLIKIFLNLDESTKLVLISLFQKELEKLNKEVIDINTDSGMKKYKTKKDYIELIKFFSDYKINESDIDK
ncbi:MAG: hypothetical protein E7C50_00220 [Clostridium sp.]|uniref:hypothetical protein n=1 Tax=Clostridium sp. TaxID=1506 RepID=UPI0029027E9B|nr:hypothetical protein [Clostridium sp.]MDU2674005.1 hypothetical protein [Clostridium sp.]MDU2680283.1 hypothetical protein [Clostridium sp.]